MLRYFILLCFKFCLQLQFIFVICEQLVVSLIGYILFVNFISICNILAELRCATLQLRCDVIVQEAANAENVLAHYGLKRRWETRSILCSVVFATQFQRLCCWKELLLHMLSCLVQSSSLQGLTTFSMVLLHFHFVTSVFYSHP